MAKKAAEKPIPRIFRKPMIPASVLLALDILTLAAAAVLNAVHGHITERYFYADGVVSRSNPYSWFGIAAAVLMVIAAAVTAVIIAGGFLARERGSFDLVFEIVAAVLLLALSAGAAEENRLVFAEEQYRSENLLKIYLVKEASEPEGECVRLVCVELKELSQGNAEERYTIKYITESALLVTFSDGTAYRTLELTI